MNEEKFKKAGIAVGGLLLLSSVFLLAGLVSASQDASPGERPAESGSAPSTDLAASEENKVASLPPSLNLGDVIVGVGWERIETDRAGDSNLIFHSAGQGSIVSWKGKTIILTCAHTIEVSKLRGDYQSYEEMTFVVKNRDRISTARVAYVDTEGRDLALLQVDEDSFYEGTNPLEIKEGKVEWGDKVFNPITPLGRNINGADVEVKVKEGNVVKVDSPGKSWIREKLFQTEIDIVDFPARSGDSGSVVISSEGEVVGVVVVGYCPLGSKTFCNTYIGFVADQTGMASLLEIKNFLGAFDKNKE